MKRILALILCLICIICLSGCGNEGNSTESTAESTSPSSNAIPGVTNFPTTPSEGLAYEVNDDGISCTITGIGECTDWYIFVGDEIDGYTVTSIGSAAFYCNSDILGIKLSDSITSVGNYAFFDCGSLRIALLGEGVISLGQYAFAGCKMTTITIPDSIETVAEWAFYDCFLLEEVRIADLNRWFAISFGGSYSNPLQCAGNLYVSDKLLTELTIPAELQTVGQWAFAGCTSLTKVNFHEHMVSIAQRAFMDCDNLTSATYADTIEQWNMIEKGSNWNFHVKELTIVCTDGEA